MKWMHLVSEGFIHQGNQEEVISFSANLLGTLTQIVLEPEGYGLGLETALCHLLAKLGMLITDALSPLGIHSVQGSVRR